jgi:hypothetical protein
MKTTHSLVAMATRVVLGLALLMTLGIGLALPTPTHRGPESVRLSAVPTIQVADGTESNGGKGDKPKKRHIAFVA